MKTAHLIVNPRAGKNSGYLCAKKALQQLELCGISTTIFQTTAPQEATNLATNSALDCDAIFVVGGDGTLTEVARGLTTPTPPPLGIIPVGTANVVARELSIPLGNPEAAVDAALAGAPRDFDLPMANEDVFLANVGVGFDADVVFALHAHRQQLARDKSISMLSYLPCGLRALLGHRPPRLAVTVDGQALEGSFADVIVCNTANYGGLLSVTPSASPHDGQLDVYLRRRTSRFGIIRHLASAVLRWKDQGAVTRIRGTDILIDAEKPSCVQIDGDPVGCTPVHICLGTEKIKILTPDRSRK